MVREQLRGRGIRDERVLEVMGQIPRERFIDERLRREAYADEAVPIEHGQTISQPWIVARMTELLAARGLSCEPLYRLPRAGPVEMDDTHFRWTELIAAGFPYVKARVLEEFWGATAMKWLIPAEILDGYEFANSRPLESPPDA